MDKKKVVAPKVCHGHSWPVVDVFYSPVTLDGLFLVSAGKDATPMLRNGETGDWVGTFQGHKGAVWSCCLDKHALRAASASTDFSAYVDSHFLLNGGTEKALRVFDINWPDATPRKIEKARGSVCTVTWLHSDQSILGSCTDVGGERLWDVRTGTIVQTLETKPSVTSAEVSQDGCYITTPDGSAVKFWDANQYANISNHQINEDSYF